MSEAPTVRTTLDPDGARESVRRLVTRPGRRHRCTTCLARGLEHEPAYLCHHCGRLFCEICAPRPGELHRFFFHHQELTPLNVTGIAFPAAGQPAAEAAHCTRCSHHVPRMLPWLVLSTLLALLLMGLLWFTYWESAVVTGGPLALFVFLAAGGFAWRAYDSRYRCRLFFPLAGERPRFLLMEEVVAEGVLDGSYRERVDRNTPRGTLRATVPLHGGMAAALDAFARIHQLSEPQLEELDAKAGAILLERTDRIDRPDPPWPVRGARAWTLAAPLPRWPLVWTGRGAGEKVLEFGYRVQMDGDGGSPFPLQLQAQFPEDSDGLALQLSIVPAGPSAAIPASIQQIVLRRGRGLPAFALQPGRGRPVSRQSEAEVEIGDLPFDADNAARLALRFKTAPTGEAAWLSGSLLLVLPTLLSGMEIDGYYSPLGYRDDRIQVEQFSRILLHFQINVASLALQQTSRHAETIELPGSLPERDDAVLRALADKAWIVRVHENALDGGTANHPKPTALQREILGHWPMPLGDQLSPVIFRAHFLPQEDMTRLKVEVEAPVTDSALLATRGRDIGDRIKAIVLQADKGYRKSRRNPPARPPSDDKGATLLSKLEGERDE